MWIPITRRVIRTISQPVTAAIVAATKIPMKRTKAAAVQIIPRGAVLLQMAEQALFVNCAIGFALATTGPTIITYAVIVHLTLLAALFAEK